MFNNKKLVIRLVAIVLTLVMAGAMFVGCSTKALEEQLNAAQSEAEAAKLAAAEANQAAISAASAAAELAKQLQTVKDNADKDAAELAKELDKVKAAASAAESKLESIANAKPPETTGGSINEGEYDKTSEEIAKIAAELGQMKAKYLTIRSLWYTEFNYLKLAQLFEDADNNIYRATTPESLKGVMTKLASDIAAVPSIMSDSDVIQAQISAFGDIDSELFTTHKANVTKAREDYKKWLNTYRSYFAANGLNVDSYETLKIAIDSLAQKTFGLATTNLRYAESKISTLELYAKKVSDEAYLAIKAIWDKTAYADIKGSYEAIEAAYALYKIFVVANGGDSSPVVLKDETTDPKRMLTGDLFVKQYVLVLYDNWLAQYQSAAKTFIDDLPAYFMAGGGDGANALGIYNDVAKKVGDVDYTPTYINDNYTVTYGTFIKTGFSSQQLLNEFERIATLNNAEMLKPSFSADYKGTNTLDDAFLKVEKCMANALIEMSALYYQKIALVEIKNHTLALKDSVTALAASTDEIFKTFDIAFANEYKLAVDAYVSALDSTKTKTYDELKNNKDVKLDTLSVITATKGAGGDLNIVVSNATKDAIIASLKATIDSATKSYAEAKAELTDSKAFYDFRVDLAKELPKYVATMDNKDDAIFAGINSARGSNVDKTIADNLLKANNAISDAFRAAAMALKYNDYAATTYQAKASDGKVLYYDKAALDAALTSTTPTDRNALTIKVDKLVVAKNAVVALYATYADQMFTKLLDLCRTQVGAYIDKSVEVYRTNYAGDATIDTLNLKTDVENYITYLKGLTTLNTIGTFDPADFSVEKDVVDSGVKLDTLTAYKVETVTANKEYIFHVKDYATAATAPYIANTSDADPKSFTKRAEAKVPGFCNMGISASDDNAYKCLEKVRFLAYYKDSAIVTLRGYKNDMIGVYDTKTDKWTTPVKDAAYNYDYYSSRKVMYLAELENVYNRIIAKINAVTLLNSSYDYTKAIGKVDRFLVDADYNNDGKIDLAYYHADTDGKKKASSNDDLSFVVAYYRYYKVNADGTTAYNWSAYNS